MSTCRTCCVSDILIVEDVDAFPSFYPTTPFSVVVNCPPGYVCQPGEFPKVVIIDPATVPPLIVPREGGTASIQSCSGPLSATVPFGASDVQIRGIMQGLWQQYAQAQASCNATTGRVQVPKSKANRFDVWNAEQCFDAYCADHTVGGHSCVAARTYGQTIFDPDPATIQAIQDSMNGLALAQATSQAQAIAGPVCGVCNSPIHAFATCPGDPGKLASFDIAGGTYCAAAGTAQYVVDSQAQGAAFNAVQGQLAALGCLCTGSVDLTTRLLSTTCPLTFTLTTLVGNLIPPPNVMAVNGANFDIDAAYHASTGDHLHGPIRITPNFVAPSFIIIFP